MRRFRFRLPPRYLRPKSLADCPLSRGSPDAGFLRNAMWLAVLVGPRLLDLSDSIFLKPRWRASRRRDVSHFGRLQAFRKNRPMIVWWLLAASRLARRWGFKKRSEIEGVANDPKVSWSNCEGLSNFLRSLNCLFHQLVNSNFKNARGAKLGF